ARSVDEQRGIYEGQIRDRLWTGWIRWFLARHATLSLIGVPWPQRNEIVMQYPGGIAQFIRDCFEVVFTQLPLASNYCGRVYSKAFTPPPWPRESPRGETSARPRGGLLDRLKIHTASVTDFLHATPSGISKFVLLDHMDWMSWYYPQ